MREGKEKEGDSGCKLIWRGPKIQERTDKADRRGRIDDGQMESTQLQPAARPDLPEVS